MKSFPLIVALVAALAVSAAANEPDFDFCYSDGLYATITLPKRIEKPDLENEERISLSVPGFRKEMKVRALWQTEGKDRVMPAPLAVPLLGLAGSNKDELARVWQSLLFESGCHVMTADSTFSYDFNKISGFGVSGNIEAEAEAVARVIEAFLNTPRARDKITEVRLLGASYGGNVALYLAKMNEEGRLQFTVGTVMALSPAVSLRTSARILDEFYEQDFGSYNYNVLKLRKLRNKAVVAPGAPAPFEPRLMRAGIGYVFHKDLKTIVKENDTLYDLDLLDQYERLGDRRGKAGNWTFTQFVEGMSFPYWHARGAVETIDDFWEMGGLENLLPCFRNSNVTVYLSKDDPLNDPAEVAALETLFDPPLFNVLPGGGHLGFAESEWVRKTVKNAFGPQS